MKKIVILTLLLLGLCGCTSNEKTEIKQVTCNEKDEIIEKESHAMLIDVRTKEEYEANHFKVLLFLIVYNVKRLWKINKLKW